MYREQEKGLWALGAERAQLCNLSQGPQPPRVSLHLESHVRSTSPGLTRWGLHLHPPLTEAGSPCLTLQDWHASPASEGPQERVRGGQGPRRGGQGCARASRVLLVEVGTTPTPAPAQPDHQPPGACVLGLGLASAVVWGLAASWCCGRAWIRSGTVLV